MQILFPRNNKTLLAAAKVFQELCRKVTGTAPSFTEEVNEKEKDYIVLGGDSVNTFTHSKILDHSIPVPEIRMGSDDFQILSAEEGEKRYLFLMAGSPGAIFYAVYTYFEKGLNCRYFWDGDIIPESKTLPLEGWTLLERPRFTYRGIRYFAHRGLKRFQPRHWTLEEWKKEIDFLLKKKMNLFMLRMGLDDLFQKAFPDAVPYPEGYAMDFSTPRSYDDHTLFMPLKDSGDLQRAILEYAAERGLIHPEDIGTMTHWYSRTPKSFLENCKPGFLPQKDDSYYKDPSGQVWDIRKDENLEYYYHLTRTHIKDFLKTPPRLFHTIGLAERHTYSDHLSNHKMKLYTYQRIQERLRRDYPDTPLLIATWEFLDWTLEEVRDLIRTFDGEKTILLDYIADIEEEKNTLPNWGLTHEHQWILGVFHSNENNSELRGNYPLIEKRLFSAMDDPRCKGVVLWPETSHADTLMLEYLACNAWNPSPETISIRSFLKKFSASRYEASYIPRMEKIWLLAINTIEKRIRFAHNHKHQTSQLYFIRPISLFPEMDCLVLSRYTNTLTHYAAFWHTLPELFLHLSRLAEDEKAPEFVLRDLRDIAKSAAATIMDIGFAAFQYALELYRLGMEEGNKDEILSFMELFLSTEKQFIDFLKSTEEFSLYHSLEELRLFPNANMDFEFTLKGNAENSYSRSYIPEIMEFCALPEMILYFEEVKKRLCSEERDSGIWKITEEMKEGRKAILDLFYSIPLKEMAPDIAAGKKVLPETLKKLSLSAEQILDYAEKLIKTIQ